MQAATLEKSVGTHIFLSFFPSANTLSRPDHDHSNGL
jgi:hypothetical protein